MNGVEQTKTYYDKESDQEIEVPSYVVLHGSMNEAAKELGLRILGRREVAPNVSAELHERGAGLSFWAVPEMPPGTTRG
jgi:hypothetical protein